MKIVFKTFLICLIYNCPKYRLMWHLNIYIRNFSTNTLYFSLKKEKEKKNTLYFVPKLLGKIKTTTSYEFLIIYLVLYSRHGRFSPWSHNNAQKMTVLPLYTLYIVHYTLHTTVAVLVNFAFVTTQHYCVKKLYLF